MKKVVLWNVSVPEQGVRRAWHKVGERESAERLLEALVPKFISISALLAPASTRAEMRPRVASAPVKKKISRRKERRRRVKRPLRRESLVPKQVKDSIWNALGNLDSKDPAFGDAVRGLCSQHQRSRRSIRIIYFNESRRHVKAGVQTPDSVAVSLGQA